METAIVNYVLEDQMLHFIPRHIYQGEGGGGWTWRTLRGGGWGITGRVEYILGNDRRDFF